MMYIPHSWNYHSLVSLAHFEWLRWGPDKIPRIKQAFQMVCAHQWLVGTNQACPESHRCETSHCPRCGHQVLLIEKYMRTSRSPPLTCPTVAITLLPWPPIWLALQKVFPGWGARCQFQPPKRAQTHCCYDVDSLWFQVNRGSCSSTIKLAMHAEHSIGIMVTCIVS